MCDWVFFVIEKPEQGKACSGMGHAYRSTLLLGAEISGQASLVQTPPPAAGEPTEERTPFAIDPGAVPFMIIRVLFVIQTRARKMPRAPIFFLFPLLPVLPAAV